MDEEQGRQTVVAAAMEMERLGLNHGSAGNISLRLGDAMLITPSGVPTQALTADNLSRMTLDSNGSYDGPLPPSSEWRFHLDIYRAKHEVSAVVHMHSTYATTLAVMRREIPAAHYMIAAFGGPTVRCVDYAPYGTAELSQLVVAGLEGRDGVLLANHGAIVTGASMERALWRAVELEALAEVYYLASLAGGPVILSDDEIMRTVTALQKLWSRHKEIGVYLAAKHISNRTSAICCAAPNTSPV